MKTTTLQLRNSANRSYAMLAFLLIPLACFGLLPTARAVSPPPDGGYPRGNTAEGTRALFSNTLGVENAAVGHEALQSNTTGSQNTATGASALISNTSGAGNTAFGWHALLSNTPASNNTAVGAAALLLNTIGIENCAVGHFALSGNVDGSSNVAIGDQAGTSIVHASNVICIGASVVGEDVSNSCYIGSIFGQTSSGGATVFINSAGKLGTATSSQRFKEDIQPMEHASEALFALKPVTFRYKKEIDSARTHQLGLIAEDVEKVNPDLIVRDIEGKPYSVRYDQINAMLLNEFLKEHRKVEQQATKMQTLETTVAQQQRQIAVLMSQVQKVGEQLRANTSNSQLVADNP
jgi:endosialidase-like protein